MVDLLHPTPALGGTPRNIALVTQAMIREFPERYKMYSIREFTFNDIRQHNRNRLLWRDDSVDGVKTGHTDAAGYCLVASAKRDGMRLISVVMGSPSPRVRADASQALLNYGFRFFETHLLYGAGDEITRQRVWKGAVEEGGVGLRQDLFLTVARGRYEELSAAMEIETPLMAPIRISGAASPMARDIDNRLPVRMPGAA